MNSIGLKCAGIVMMLMVGLCASSAGAQQTAAAPSQSPTPEMAPAATPEAVLAAATQASATDQVEVESFDSWVRGLERKFQPIGGVDDQGRMFFAGQSDVTNPNGANLGQQIAIAFDRAMIDMQAAYISQTFGRIVSDVTRERLLDSSTNRDNIEPAELPKTCQNGGGDRIAMLFEKTLQVAEKTLDNKLIEQGIPADQVQRSSVEQKKAIYKNNLIRDVARRAIQSMQGLVPVQTRIFTQKGTNGTRMTVGVFAAQTQKTRDFAMDMARKMPTLVTGEPKKLAEILPKDNAGFMGELGLRFTYDEKGRPMLISFGRTSITVTPDMSPGEEGEMESIAKELAKSLAEASISEFMNTSVAVNSRTSQGELAEKLVTQTTNLINCSPKSVDTNKARLNEVISTFSQNIKTTSTGSLQGTSTVRNWVIKDERGGGRQVGSVVTWTYSQLENVKKIEAQTTNRGSSGGSAGNVNGSSTSSRIINKLNDF
ncbi:MAG: hypothetical protein HQ450_15575 [Alcaligenaceae bacterium]|nr:hypothetical protein [Alcaligenaceae bacterium]